MADDDREAVGRQQRGHPLKRAADPFGDHRGRLTLGRRPRGVLDGEALPDLGVVQALPQTAGPFPQILVRGHLQACDPAERGRGAGGTLQVR